MQIRNGSELRSEYENKAAKTRNEPVIVPFYDEFLFQIVRRHIIYMSSTYQLV